VQEYFLPQGAGYPSYATVLQMWMFALSCAKGFFKIYSVSARQEEEGLSQRGHFAHKGSDGISFSQYCADVFYGEPLLKVQKNRFSVAGWLSLFRFCSSVDTGIVLNFEQK